MLADGVPLAWYLAPWGTQGPHLPPAVPARVRAGLTHRGPCLWEWTLNNMGFPGGSVVKNSSASTGDVGSIPGSGRSPGGGNGNPLQYSCLGNLMDRGAWRATVLNRKESDATERLN